MCGFSGLFSDLNSILLIIIILILLCCVCGGDDENECGCGSNSCC